MSLLRDRLRWCVVAATGLAAGWLLRSAWLAFAAAAGVACVLGMLMLAARIVARVDDAADDNDDGLSL